MIMGVTCTVGLATVGTRVYYIGDKNMTKALEFDLKDYEYTTYRDYMTGEETLIVYKKVRKPLAGKTVVFTGVLSNYERAAAKELAIKMGAVVIEKPTNVTKVHYVILGLNPGKKNRKLVDSLGAGAEILTDKEFTTMVNKFNKG